MDVEILYFIANNEGEFWPLNYDTAAPTMAEARTQREIFLGRYSYFKPCDVKIVKCTVTPVRRKAKERK